MEYDIDTIISEMDFTSNSLNDIGGLLLTNKEIEILDRYDIDYKKCVSLKEVIYLIEDILEEEEIEDLELISQSISERDYYQNTNK